MSTEIKYTDWFNKPISQQQLGTMKEYRIKTFVDGILKMEELHINRKDGTSSKMVTYFLDDNQDKNAILSKYSSISEKIKCMIYENKQIVNGFSVWDYEAFGHDKTLSFKGKEVFDSQNRVIMNCGFDIITSELITLIKTFYDDTNSLGYENLVFIFDYMINPKLGYGAYTVEDKYQSTDEIRLITDDKFVKWFPDFFKDHPYFKE
ncbi:MAG TPA: hypothetical protein DCF99_08345, partial [Flavobacteriaceae bacterium]|nr:hypothetical protein [Flavobacteriaceae bacterium]